jgi:hypothetical protein
MTDTKEKEETTELRSEQEGFESYWTKEYNFWTIQPNCEIRISSENMKLFLKTIKQLHDKSIKYWKDLSNNQSNQSIILARELKELNDFDTKKDKEIKELKENEVNYKKALYRFETFTFLENENTRIAFANKFLDKYRNKIKELQAEIEKLKNNNHKDRQPIKSTQY